MTNQSFAPSVYQQAVFDSIAQGSGDIMINAVAGSGKTTTLKQAARLLPPNVSAVFCAFNKHIADELTQALKGTPVAASTIHSIGLGTLYNRSGRPQIEGTKYNKITRDLVDAEGQRLLHAGIDYNRSEASAALLKLANMARLTLTDPKDPQALDRMAARFGIGADAWIFELVARAIAQGNQLAEDRKIIDFTDMLYLPFVWGLQPKRVDWVFVDECQDLNAAQLDLVLKLRAQGGRMVFVGDPKQSIYGFAGADPQSFWAIKSRTNAQELPLSICYRCPSAHLDLARALVPHIEARPNAPEGTVTYAKEDRLAEIVRSGDLVLCRLTAPLISWCIKLIAQRINARVKGRDLGKDLASMVDAVAKLKGFEYQDFLQYLEQYRVNMGKNILAKNQDDEAGVESLNDRVEAIAVCYSNFMAPTIASLKAEIEGLFTDEVAAITFSTVHRAKGLENDRVVLLQPEKMPLIRKGQQRWEVEQEYNLLYVALTRAKHELVILGGLTIAPAPQGPAVELEPLGNVLNALHRSIAAVAAELDQEIAAEAAALDAKPAETVAGAMPLEAWLDQRDPLDYHTITITSSAVAQEAGAILFAQPRPVAINCPFCSAASCICPNVAPPTLTNAEINELNAEDLANDRINALVDSLPQHDQEALQRGQASMPVEALDLTGVGRCNNCTPCRSGRYWDCNNDEDRPLEPLGANLTSRGGDSYDLAGSGFARILGLFDEPGGGYLTGDLPMDQYLDQLEVEAAADALEQAAQGVEGDLNEPPEILGVAEAAERLGRPERTIQLWAKEGRFAGARLISGVWVIPRAAVDNFKEPERGNPNIAQARAQRGQP